jgi:hypothetical protein
MTTHTPGPWFISYTHEDGTSIAIDDALGMDGERDYDLVTVTHGNPDELAANAKLIAAAPHMLAVLRKAALALAHASETVPGLYEEDYEEVSAAIATATGEPE